MNFFLLSGRLGVGAMKGMSKVCRAERFELKSVKIKTSALIKCKGIMSTMAEK
jgi:hypothetical protein